ncbi:MAG: hypothetical protein WDW36_000988 [Sanguina aurantia]
MDDLDAPCKGVPKLRSVSRSLQASADGLRETASALAAARSPALIIGGAVDQGDGWNDAVRLAEKLRAPVWAAPEEGRPGFPETHPLFQGTSNAPPPPPALVVVVVVHAEPPSCDPGPSRAVAFELALDSPSTHAETVSLGTGAESPTLELLRPMADRVIANRNRKQGLSSDGAWDGSCMMLSEAAFEAGMVSEQT